MEETKVVNIIDRRPIVISLLANLKSQINYLHLELVIIAIATTVYEK